jgi:pyruvate formate lyase activating enzyme
MHVEVITNIIPTLNDDDEQLGGIARWIHDKLGDLTPWHVTRFYPQYQALDLPATPVATLEHAIEIGKKTGLKFIYAGNVPGHVVKIPAVTIADGRLYRDQVSARLYPA